MASTLSSTPTGGPPTPPGGPPTPPGAGGGSGGSSKSTFDKVVSGLDKLSSGMGKLGKTFERASDGIIKTQKDFGLNIANAASMQSQALMDTVDSYTAVFKSINWNAVAEGFKIAGGGLLDIFTGGGAEAAKNAVEQLNKQIPGSSLELPVTFAERMEANKEVQSEFGVINRQLGDSLAKTAKTYGLSVKELVQARRTFATIARGDLTQVDRLQSRFVDQFERQGMSRRIALEAITKNAELIARNGTRFADAFARAAADAKKIGIDLGKIDQIGDNIIDDFEGFLESQAELGAMGFNFDFQKIQEIAETGDTSRLYFELRSQLASQNIDINNLRRSQRLALEKGLLQGMTISDLQKMAAENPKLASTEPEKPTNTILGEMMKLMMVGGPIINALSQISGALSSGLKALDTAITGLAAAIRGLGTLIGAVGVTGTVIGTLGVILSVLQMAYAKWLDNKKQAAEGDIKKGIETKNLDLVKQGQNTRARVEILENNIGVRDFNELSANRQLNKKMQQLKVKEQDELKTFKQEEDTPFTLFLKRNQKEFGADNYKGTLFQPIQPSIQSPQPQPPKKANGGIIRGPGTGESDSIPAKLSNGEYVVKAGAVKQPGVKELLDAINHGNAAKNGVENKAGGGFINRMMGRAASLQERYNTQTNNINQTRNFFNGFSRNNIGGNLMNVANSRMPGADFAQRMAQRYQTATDRKNSMVERGSGFAEFLSNKYQSVMNRNKSITESGNSAIGSLLNFGNSGKKGSGAANWLAGKLQGGMEKKDSMINSGMNFLSGLPGAGRVSNLINTFKESGVGGVQSSLMSSGLNFLKNIPGASSIGKFAKNIPGAGTFMNAFSGFRKEGVGGAIKSLASTGIGKTIGGALGTMIPIPGVGTMLGSFVGGSLAKGIGRLFGRRKKPKEPTVQSPENMGDDFSQLMANVPGMERFNMQNMFRGTGDRSSQQPAPQVVVDTAGIEQKLNSFITALNNIQINMDGAKVGKVLVNASDAAMKIGVFKSDARATL